ncbi:hypothetical protein GCWU000282_02924 [Catonella morbi ATCC 51271]|uniref:Uncharacterized protein n=1 Tax=Catonella morbi ATCC 51271 TaxID=592026 RepID=V2Z4G1_9FIRM|nr:hypothetical protein [Catonella morbi]ESL01805.1 hypothetical protein GCWU000282_02924 [Catonella morbi ATCC 51271]
MRSIQKCKFTDNPNYILKNIRETLGIESSVVYEGICSEAAYERYETGENELNLIRLFQLTDFKTAVKKDIRTVGGYNGRTKKYTKGVLLIQYMSQGITFYEVKTWNNSTMYGPKGWTGTWTIKYN